MAERTHVLIREVATTLLDDEELFAQVDQAVLGDQPEAVVGDPGFVASVRATNHANISHWLRANIERPGEPVPANVGPETLGLARDIVRRGFGDATLNGYRLGQNIAWSRWMAVAFALTDDAAVLRELLDVAAQSMFAFVDATIAGVGEQIERERAELVRGAHADRLATVNLILEGAPITAARASARLRYELARAHTAAVLWTERRDAELEETAVAAARAAGAGTPFTLGATVRSLWAWFPADASAIRSAFVVPDGVQVALGSTGTGLAGFRRSHLDALTTQRLMGPTVPVAGYEEIQVVALTTGDGDLADEFVARVLGELADDEPLRETLRVYLREGSSISAAARALFAHRNTVLNRVKRAQELLPRPLDAARLEVALALEMLHWR